MKLVIGLATRGRPALLFDTLARTVPNVSLDNTSFRLLVDQDDAETLGALDNQFTVKMAKRVSVDIRPREDTVAQKFNRLLDEPADVYMAMVDHTAYLTPGFDKAILDAGALFPDGVGVVVNHMANGSFSYLSAATAKLVEKQGCFFVEHFPYWFVDHWLDDIARLIGRVAFADVAADSSKKPMTQELREPAWWATFYDAGYRVRRKIAHDIIWSQDFQGEHWRKKILDTHYPLIDQRSKMINDSVRAQAAQLSAMSNLNLKDERYQRVRDKAVKTLDHWLNDFGMPAPEVAAWRKALTPPTTVPGLPQAFAA